MEKNKIFKLVVKMIINPYSPIATLIVGWLLTLSVTVVPKDSGLNVFVQALIDHKSTIVIILVCWIILALMYTENEDKLKQKDNKLQEKDNEILSLKRSIEEKKNQLNQSNGIILNKYGEFARFSKYNRFDEVLKGFVDNNDGVDCAQIYKYSSKINNDIMKIRLSYEQGYAYEDVDINVILQSYFSMNIEVYKRITNIILLWNRCYSENNLSELESESLEVRLFEEIKRLLTELITELRSLNNKDFIKDHHYTYYRIVVLLINFLGNERSIGYILNENEVEEFLISSKRTGILGGILLKDTYAFKHVGVSSKSGRVYISFTVELYKENYVVLIAIAPSLLNQVRSWEKMFKNLKEDFVSRLDNTN